MAVQLAAQLVAPLAVPQAAQLAFIQSLRIVVYRLHFPRPSFLVGTFIAKQFHVLLCNALSPDESLGREIYLLISAKSKKNPSGRS
jgi:hypothetical protein